MEMIALRWYNIFGYVFLILTLMLQVMSLVILCKCSRRLSGFRYRQLKLIFVFSVIQYAFRLVYEICYYTPLENYNVLCWSLRAITELSTCCTWARITIIGGYYYAILKSKRDPDEEGKCSLCVCITVWSVPLMPILLYGIIFAYPGFFDPDSCWRGETADLLNIMEAVEHMFLFGFIVTYLLFSYCHFWSKSPDMLQQLACFVPNMKGKNHLIGLFILVSIVCTIPINTRAFIDHEHDLLVVTSWCVIGLMTSLCFCFLDTEVQNAFFYKGGGFGFPSDDSEINLTQAEVVGNSLTVDYRHGNKRVPDYSGAGTLSLKSWHSQMDDIDEDCLEESREDILHDVKPGNLSIALDKK